MTVMEMMDEGLPELLSALTEIVCLELSFHVLAPKGRKFPVYSSDCFRIRAIIQ